MERSGRGKGKGLSLSYQLFSRLIRQVGIMKINENEMKWNETEQCSLSVQNMCMWKLTTHLRQLLEKTIYLVKRPFRSFTCIRKTHDISKKRMRTGQHASKHAGVKRQVGFGLRWLISFRSVFLCMPCMYLSKPIYYSSF